MRLSADVVIAGEGIARVLIDKARVLHLFDSLEADSAVLSQALDTINASATVQDFSELDYLTFAHAVFSALSLSPLVVETMETLMEKNLFPSFIGTIISLPPLLAEARGSLIAHVTSAVPLSENQKQQLTDALKGSSSAPVWLQAHVDPRLLGGLKIQLGHRIFDDSIDYHLRRLAQEMKGQNP